MFFYFIICYIILAYYYISVLSLQYTIILLLYYSIILLCFFILFSILCSFILYSLFSILCFIFYIIIYHLFSFIIYSLFFILYLYIYIYKRREEKNKERLKNKRGEKKVSKKSETENFQKQPIFQRFQRFCVFSELLYILCFSSFHEGYFCPQNSGVFCRCSYRFLPFFCRRYSVTFVAVQRGGCLYALPTPPLYRRSRNKSNPKKNFFIFFNIDIWRNFYFLFFFIFFTIWHIVMVNRCLRCGVMFVILELRGILDDL